MHEIDLNDLKDTDLPAGHHIHDDGTIHHDDDHDINMPHDETSHSHSHGHTHSHEQTRSVINRLSRAIGHLESIKRMVEEGRDCTEVLVQLSAVKAAINNTSKVILKDHIDHCIVDAVKTGDMTAIDELNKAIMQFIK